MEKHIVKCRFCSKEGEMDETWHHFHFRFAEAHVYACSHRCAYYVLLSEWSRLDRAYQKLLDEAGSLRSELDAKKYGWK